MIETQIDWRIDKPGNPEQWDAHVLEHAGNPTQLSAFGHLGGWLRRPGYLRLERGHERLQWLIYLSRLVPGCWRIEARSEPTTSSPALVDEAIAFLLRELRPVRFAFYDMVFSRWTDADWLSKHRFTPVEHFGTIELDLSIGPDALRSGMQKKQRNRVNLGRRTGLQLESLRGPSAAPRVYNLVQRTLARNGAPAPSLDYVRRMAEALGDQAQLFAVTLDGRDVGTSFEIITPARALGWLAGTTDDAPNGTANFMQWAIIEHLAEQGVARYDLGGVDPDAPEGSKGARILHSKRKYGGALVHCYGGTRCDRPLAAHIDGLAERGLDSAKSLLRSLRS